MKNLLFVQKDIPDALAPYDVIAGGMDSYMAVRSIVNGEILTKHITVNEAICIATSQQWSVEQAELLVDALPLVYGSYSRSRPLSVQIDLTLINNIDINTNAGQYTITFGYNDIASYTLSKGSGSQQSSVKMSPSDPVKYFTEAFRRIKSLTPVDDFSHNCYRLIREFVLLPEEFDNFDDFDDTPETNDNPIESKHTESVYEDKLIQLVADK